MKIEFSQRLAMTDPDESLILYPEQVHSLQNQEKSDLKRSFSKKDFASNRAAGMEGRGASSCGELYFYSATLGVGWNMLGNKI